MFSISKVLFKNCEFVLNAWLLSLFRFIFCFMAKTLSEKWKWSFVVMDVCRFAPEKYPLKYQLQAPTPDRGPLSHIVVACNCSINLLEYRFLPYWTGQDFRLDRAKKGEGEGTPSECFPLTFCKFMAFI